MQQDDAFEAAHAAALDAFNEGDLARCRDILYLMTVNLRPLSYMGFAIYKQVI